MRTDGASNEHITLINGLMQRFATSGDAVDGLRWALPRVLDMVHAEAGSLFLHLSLIHI